MIVYRITLAKWAGTLTASGRAARWNSHGNFLVYTAGTRSLACLENVVHRVSIGPDEQFKVTLIKIPDSLTIDDIRIGDLPSDWKEYTSYSACQELGDQWIKNATNAVLRVPSAIINEEYNYLLNPLHADFSKIKVDSLESFSFDDRLINILKN